MRWIKVGMGKLSLTEPKTDYRTMKVIQKNSKGETRELLLKEYFLNAYLIAMLKRVGDEAGKFNRRKELPELTPVRVKSR